MTVGKWITVALLAGAGAAAFYLYPHAAKAADLAGKDNGMSDLEERVAELESIVAHKGTRKLTLVISGEISKALLWSSGLTGLSSDHHARVIDNGNSGSKVRLTGEAKISPQMKAGFIFEYGFNETGGQGIAGPAGSVVHFLDGSAELRKSAVWLETAVGRITVGKFSLATDGITEIDISNTGIASRMMSIDPVWSYVGLGGLPIVGGNLLNPAPFQDLRGEIVRYDSPAIAGFVLSGAWGGGQTATGDDEYDVALKYAGEAGGFKFAAGAGYRVEKYSTGLLFIIPPGASDQQTVSGSASMKHALSGIFVTAAIADQKNNPLYGHIQMWHAKAGWEKNVFGFGATSIYAEYAEHKLPDMTINSNFWGAGAVQQIDAAAMDTFIAYRQYQSDVLNGNATTIMVGARLHF